MNKDLKSWSGYLEERWRRAGKPMSLEKWHEAARGGGYNELYDAWRKADRPRRLAPIWKGGRWMAYGERFVGRGGKSRSGFFGVFATGRRGKPWRVVFRGECLGSFSTAEEAASRYDRRARMVKGASLNFA